MIRKTDMRVYALIGLLVTVLACISSTAVPASTPTLSGLKVSTPTITKTPENTPFPTFTLVVLTPPTLASTDRPGPAQTDTGWQGEYFNNNAFQEPVTLTRMDADLIFDWKDGSPDPSIPNDTFSVRWTRCLELEGREYIFRARADDYVRVLVDEVQVLEAPILANIEMPIAMSAGGHCIKVEYREDGGTAGVYFTFE